MPAWGGSPPGFPTRSGTPGLDLLPGAGTAGRGRVVLRQKLAEHHPSAREPHRPDRPQPGRFRRLYPRQRVPTDLKDILQSTIDLVRFDKNFKKIEVRTDVRNTHPIKLDPDQMQQVFLNLLLNARDAMPDGGKLDITVTQSNNHVEMVFADTGSGIDTEVKDKVFDPSSPPRGRHGGPGWACPSATASSRTMAVPLRSSRKRTRAPGSS